MEAWQASCKACCRGPTSVKGALLTAACLPTHALLPDPAPPQPRPPTDAGLADGERLALYVHSPDMVKHLLIPPSFLRRFPALGIRTDLVDMQVCGGLWTENCAWQVFGGGMGE